MNDVLPFETTDPHQRQLTMARYAMHCMRLRDYAMLHTTGKLTFEQAAEEYRKAMENFDQILELAVTEPGRMPPIEDDMERGFYIPE